MASIKKIHDRKFKITVSNGYRADGSKITRSKTITVPSDVKRRRIGQYVVHAAEEMERMVKDGYSEYSEMPFEAYAERWLERQTKYTPSTLASYRRMLKVIYPYIGHIRLNRLKPIALENMLIELRKRKTHGKLVQEVTVQKYLTVASAVLSDAKRNEIIPRNPAHLVSLPAVSKNEQEIPASAQIEALLAAFRREPQPYRLFYLMAIHTGSRRGELCALRWSDLQMQNENAMIVIRRSRSNVLGSGIQEGRTKSGRERILVADAAITQELTAYALEREPMPDEHVFADASGALIHPDTFTKRLKKICRRCGLPDAIHLHTLRHIYVTTLLHSGVDKQTVADLVGHSDTGFLERVYCHPQLEAKIKAAKEIEQQLSGSENK